MKKRVQIWLTLAVLVFLGVGAYWMTIPTTPPQGPSSTGASASREAIQQEADSLAEELALGEQMIGTVREMLATQERMLARAIEHGAPAAKVAELQKSTSENRLLLGGLELTNAIHRARVESVKKQLAQGH